MQSIYLQKIEEEQLSQYLPEVNMSNRDKEIVQKYLTKKVTYKKLGEIYGISGERVRQIIVKFNRKAHGLSLKRKREADASILRKA